jgi:hypothetical protein
MNVKEIEAKLEELHVLIHNEANSKNLIKCKELLSEERELLKMLAPLYIEQIEKASLF